MAFNCVNQKTSNALRGQSAIVTLNSSQEGLMSQLVLGQVATISSSGNTGTVSMIDLYGNTFRVAPIAPNKRFDSTSTPGFLNVTDVITITT